jgi:hypothetical protein
VSYGWHRPTNGSRTRPAAVYFRDGTDEPSVFEAVLTADDEDGYREMGIVWREQDAERIVAALSGI